MAIRGFSPGDLTEVVELFGRSVREVSCRDYSSLQVHAWAPDTPDLAAWQERLSAGQVWLYEESGRIAGFIRLEEDGHIDLLYVHPEFQRRGIASALLAKGLEWATQNGVSRLFTEASITARPFFEHFSFQLVRPQKVSLRGMVFENFVMEREL